MKKILLLFGAGGSLGSGASNVLTKKDFDKIYLFDRKEIKFSEEKIITIKVSDLTDEEAVKDAFGKVEFTKEDEYFLFSTVGGFAGGDGVRDTDYSTWKKMTEINLNSSFLIAKHFLANSENMKSGSICFTSAATSFNPKENQAAYGASKSGLNYLVKTLSKECKNFNISVNAIAPFVLDTKENREWVENSSIMVSSEAIGELLYSLFSNYKIVSGNVIELPGTLK